MYTVGQLGRKFGLSRTALLYYDRTGLLKPSGRSEAGYRQYTERDAQRLEKVCQYREAGLRLRDIKSALDGPSTELAQALEKRLEELNSEVRRLRDQQRLILGLLKNPALIRRVGVMNKQQWVDMLASAGFSEEDMRRWHVDFERTSPEKHQEFLEFLCIPSEEIRAIRQWSRESAAAREAQNTIRPDSIV